MQVGWDHFIEPHFHPTVLSVTIRGDANFHGADIVLLAGGPRFDMAF
jgi:hypothetical protein